MSDEILTLQQVADFAARGLLKQMKICKEPPSENQPFPGCLYTNSEGLHCGIGFALTPEQQARVGAFMGSAGTLCTCEDFPDIAKRFSQCDLDSLHELQIIHDEKDPEFWRESLRDFYKKHGLTFPSDL